MEGQGTRDKGKAMEGHDGTVTNKRQWEGGKVDFPRVLTNQRPELSAFILKAHVHL